jgi:hypothetical protein
MTTVEDYTKARNEVTRTANISAVLLGISFILSIALGFLLPDNLLGFALAPLLILGIIASVKIYRSASVRNYAFQSWAKDAYGLNLKLSLSERLREGYVTHIGDEIWVFVEGDDLRSPLISQIQNQAAV